MRRTICICVNRIDSSIVQKKTLQFRHCTKQFEVWDAKAENCRDGRKFARIANMGVISEAPSKV